MRRLSKVWHLPTFSTHILFSLYGHSDSFSECVKLFSVQGTLHLRFSLPGMSGLSFTLKSQIKYHLLREVFFFFTTLCNISHPPFFSNILFCLFFQRAFENLYLFIDMSVYYLTLPKNVSSLSHLIYFETRDYYKYKVKDVLRERLLSVESRAYYCKRWNGRLGTVFTYLRMPW